MCKKARNTEGRLLSLPEFECISPETVAEAVLALNKYKGKAKVISGGTDIINQMKRRVITPEYLINIKNIEDLDYIKEIDGEIHIGATTSIANVLFSEMLRKKYPIFAEATGFIATPQIRSRGTMMGNLCNAIPSADSAPPLIVHDAYINVVGENEIRSILVEDFLVAPKVCALRDGELATEIVIPMKNGRSTYYKHQTRAEGDLAVVGVAVYLEMDDNGKICKDAKIALSAVGPTPLRAPNAEKILIGSVLDDKVIEKAAVAASEESKPIDDIRSSAWYRKEMVMVNTKRAINHILKDDCLNVIM